MAEDTFVPWITYGNMLALGALVAMVAIVLVAVIPLPSVPSWAPLIPGAITSVIYYLYAERGLTERAEA